MFSKNLKAVMDERNMTQARLSTMTGVGKSGISQYLSGKNTPKAAVVQKLADALETSADYLLRENVETDPASNGESGKKVTVAMAARRMGKSEQFVRIALQRANAPFGFAIRMPSGKWSYHISPKKFADYVG